MELSRNRFKAGLRAGRHQIGIWNAMPGRMIPEILARAGFDWIVVDCEHAPTSVGEVLSALQAIAGIDGVSAVVRPEANDPVLIKRLLDIGAQSLLIPYIQSGEEARAAVAATRYPPEGIRGVAGHHRASGYGTVPDYIARAAQELCVILQIETAAGLDALDEIATTPGVDGVFIGPADLSASLGHPGDPGHPEVQARIDAALDRLVSLKVPSGILYVAPDLARAAMARGTLFTAVGLDVMLLAGGATSLRASFAGG